jgi:signal peptidase I
MSSIIICVCSDYLIIFRGHFTRFMKRKTLKDFAWAKFILDVLLDVAIVIVLVLLFRHFLYAPFQIHGPSMCDTFNVYGDECHSGDGEYVLTSRLSNWGLTSIQRGDVVVFQAPYGEKGEFFIKRVIGLPGDSVKIDSGLVYVMNEDGDYEELEEDYLNEDNVENTHPHRSTFEVFEVPEDSYFVLGDNRTRSSDSRRCFQQLGCDGNSSPFLEHELVEGEVKVVVYPLSHMKFVRGVDY